MINMLPVPTAASRTEVPVYPTRKIFVTYIRKKKIFERTGGIADLKISLTV